MLNGPKQKVQKSSRLEKAGCFAIYAAYRFAERAAFALAVPRSGEEQDVVGRKVGLSCVCADADEVIEEKAAVVRLWRRGTGSHILSELITRLFMVI